MTLFKSIAVTGCAFVVTGFATGCSIFSQSDKPPLATVAAVDLQKYSGPWFIIASIPLEFEKGAHNPVESYAVNPDGSIATVFQFRKDAFDGEQITKVTNAKVEPGSGNAVWQVQLIWPIRGEYRIGYLEPDYSSAIITREARDHVWILSRKPKMSDADYTRYTQKIAAMGYDTSKLLRFAQNGDMPTPGIRPTRGQ